MSDKAMHCVVGVGVGALAAAYKAHGQPRDHMLLEVLGGSLGAFLGARLPDLIDPPIHPRHRNIGHGALTASVIGASLWNSLDDVQNAIRAKADELHARLTLMPEGAERAMYQIAEWLLRMLAGTCAALVPGYGSHLALDMTTPSGIPLIARGF